MIAALRRFWWETLPDALFAVRERMRGSWMRLRGARGYRYAGERDTHEEQLRETQIALSMMATAPEDQTRMASDLEHGAENRLTVLLEKPRLSVAEKRERDAIQAALQARRQSFDVDAPVPAVRGFLGPMAVAGGVKLWMILAAGWALTGGFALIQMGLKERIEDQRDDARADLAMTERSLEAARETQERLADAVRAADAQTQQTAATIEQERARTRAAQREARRIRDAMDQVRDGGSIDYGFGGVRDAGGAAPGPGGDRSANRDPGGM